MTVHVYASQTSLVASRFVLNRLPAPGEWIVTRDPYSKKWRAVRVVVCVCARVVVSGLLL